MVRPVKELAGFARIFLRPGEKKKVTFALQASQTAFLDAQMRWKVEKGLVKVGIGASSEDIRLEGQYRIEKDAWIDGKKRAFWAKATLNMMLGSKAPN